MERQRYTLNAAETLEAIQAGAYILAAEGFYALHRNTEDLMRVKVTGTNFETYCVARRAFDSLRRRNLISFERKVGLHAAKWIGGAK